MYRTLTLLLFFLTWNGCSSASETTPILTGADQLETYLPKLRDRRVGLFVNHTSLIGERHLTDTLLSLGISIPKVFSPEHGFAGNRPDGEKIEGETSADFELISLYGKSRKPTDEQLSGIDLLVIDIQDVGVRCYTYSSTMTYLMEACARLNVPVILLDRPNPNGSYIDGPVLQEKFKSFIGLHPIPLVHGLTLGELAQMINEELWLEGQVKCELEVIRVKNWKHSQAYSLPVPPSPNLPNDLSVALYPSLVLLEQTVVSVGRGTAQPFQVLGHPLYTPQDFFFIPLPNTGSQYPPLEGEICYGLDLSGDTAIYALKLGYLLEFYNKLEGKTEDPFYNSYFKNLVGTDQLVKQLEEGWSEEEIRESWKADLDAYQKLRKRYLFYPE